MAYLTPCVKDGLLRFFEGGWQCYYDTDLGRWTQMDPVGGTVGNPYVYANDLPNMLVDPSGRSTCVDAGILLGAVTAIAAITLIATGPVAPIVGLRIILASEVGIL